MPARSQVQPLSRALAIGGMVLAVIVCGIAFWSARSRWKTGPDSSATKVYDDGNWTAAAEFARQSLTLHKDDPSALRLLARASARLGRDSTAMAIYERRLDRKTLEAEDLLLLGSMLQRQGRPGAAAMAWKQVLEAREVTPKTLEELTRLCVQSRRWNEAILAAERLSREPAWEARGSLMLGTIRLELENVPAAASSFQKALELDATVIDTSHDPIPLRKLMARTFSKVNQPDRALPLLQAILDRAPDAEAAWLASRAHLQRGDKDRALSALKLAGAYRAENPMEPEPSPYVGEARCENCHAKIFRDSLANRHTRTYYRGPQLNQLTLPPQPLPDPDDATVTHAFQKKNGQLHEETRVGKEVFDAIIDYAFGTDDRYLTMVGRDKTGGYHISRLSYYHTSNGSGWDRSALDTIHPTRGKPSEFQGELVGVREGLAKCLYCHVTHPRTGNESLGPEVADRAIGCERCHGPGGNHIAALASGFPDLAIISPAAASRQAVSVKQCNDCHILERKLPEGDLENPGWIRSQGIGFSRSRCNTESNGSFGCVTCHDPHKSARATNTAEYERKCLECHQAEKALATREKSGSIGRPVARTQSVACPVNPSTGCLGCHMPRVRDESLHLELTDHYIRVRRPAK
jgi:predicted CXXCH cytochrome family protein